MGSNSLDAQEDIIDLTCPDSEPCALGRDDTFVAWESEWNDNCPQLSEEAQMREMREIMRLWHIEKELSREAGLDNEEFWFFRDHHAILSKERTSASAIPLKLFRTEGARGGRSFSAASLIIHRIGMPRIQSTSWFVLGSTELVQAICEFLQGENAMDWPVVFVPISSETGLSEVHYTWAGAFVLEAAALLHPHINFVLTDGDCVPASRCRMVKRINQSSGHYPG